MKIPIIMCTWRRLKGFANVIQQLNEQTCGGFELFVWNNNIQAKDVFESAAKEAEFDVHFHHSKENIGGFGRFYTAKSLYEKDNSRDFCIFIDDDNVFKPDSLQILASEAEPHTIISSHGWRFKTPYYFDRYQPEPGKTVDYAGTGGMIAHTPVFAKDGLYQCPEQYWFVEDLWLSFYARKFCDYKLYQSASGISTAEYEHALLYSTAELKVEMLAAMVEHMGYKIGGDDDLGSN